MTCDTRRNSSAHLDVLDLAEHLRAIDSAALEALGLLRGVEPEIASSMAFVVAADDIEQAVARGTEIVELADSLRELLVKIPAAEVEVRWRDIQHQAGAEIAAGPSDAPRLLMLCRCMSRARGFECLAAALRCTEAYRGWIDLSIGDLLSSLRDVDERIVREVTEAACLSPTLRISTCDRHHVTALASALERHAGAFSSPPPFDAERDRGQR